MAIVRALARPSVSYAFSIATYAIAVVAAVEPRVALAPAIGATFGDRIAVLVRQARAAALRFTFSLDTRPPRAVLWAVAFGARRQRPNADARVAEGTIQLQLTGRCAVLSGTHRRIDGIEQTVHEAECPRIPAASIGIGSRAGLAANRVLVVDTRALPTELTKLAEGLVVAALDASPQHTRARQPTTIARPTQRAVPVLPAADSAIVRLEIADASIGTGQRRSASRSEREARTRDDVAVSRGIVAVGRDSTGRLSLADVGRVAKLSCLARLVGGARTGAR